MGSECGCETRGFGFPPQRFVRGAAWSSSQHGSRVLRMNIPSDKRSDKFLGVWKCHFCLIPLAAPSQTHVESREGARCCLVRPPHELLCSILYPQISFYFLPCVPAPWLSVSGSEELYTNCWGFPSSPPALSQSMYSKNCLPQLHPQL